MKDSDGKIPEAKWTDPTDFDKELLKQHNAMRQTPGSFKTDLEQLNTDFNGNLWRMHKDCDGNTVKLFTQEGKKPVDEMLERIKTQKVT